MLTFDPAEHRYFYNGKPVLNVTRVLDLLTDYSKVPPDTLELARQKGIAVHRMVELHAKDDLDEQALPEWMQPVIKQWLKFIAETGFRVVCSEYRVYHPNYGYAGTLDLFGLMGSGEHAFVDVKRSFMSGKTIGFQIAAYQAAYVAQEKVGKNARRYALRLTERGPYRMQEYDHGADFQKFLTCLAYYRIKEECK